MTEELPEPLKLAKGANAGLRDLDAELGSVTVVLETGDCDGESVDADVSVLLLGADGRVRANDDLVFYNHAIALDGAIHLREKLRTQDAGQPVSADV
ncbi:MAG: stress response protein TerZ, partial [Jatrophihabitans sp.]|nr:stress response protein TerZ [Jatrophihabitans sp.]